MSLCRYLGDEDESDNPPKEDSANTILEKIHQQARLRKKKRESLNTDGEKPGQSEDGSPKKKHKQQKEDTCDNDSPHPAGLKRMRDNEEEENGKTAAKKKRKSVDKKKKDIGAGSHSSKNVPKKSIAVDSDGDDEMSDDISDELHGTGDSGVESEGDGNMDVDDEEGVYTKHDGQEHKEIGGFTVIGDVFKKKKEKVNWSAILYKLGVHLNCQYVCWKSANYIMMLYVGTKSSSWLAGQSICHQQQYQNSVNCFRRLCWSGQRPPTVTHRKWHYSSLPWWASNLAT